METLILLVVYDSPDHFAAVQPLLTGENHQALLSISQVQVKSPKARHSTCSTLNSFAVSQESDSSKVPFQIQQIWSFETLPAQNAQLSSM